MNRPLSPNQAYNLIQAFSIVSADLILAESFSGKHISRNCWNSYHVGVPQW
jgi:hypothetical protein